MACLSVIMLVAVGCGGGDGEGFGPDASPGAGEQDPSGAPDGGDLDDFLDAAGDGSPSSAEPSESSDPGSPGDQPEAEYFLTGEVPVGQGMAIFRAGPRQSAVPGVFDLALPEEWEQIAKTGGSGWDDEVGFRTPTEPNVRVSLATEFELPYNSSPEQFAAKFERDGEEFGTLTEVEIDGTTVAVRVFRPDDGVPMYRARYRVGIEPDPTTGDTTPVFGLLTLEPVDEPLDEGVVEEIFVRARTSACFVEQRRIDLGGGAGRADCPSPSATS